MGRSETIFTYASPDPETSSMCILTVVDFSQRTEATKTTPPPQSLVDKISSMFSPGSLSGQRNTTLKIRHDAQFVVHPDRPLIAYNR